MFNDDSFQGYSILCCLQTTRLNNGLKLRTFKKKFELEFQQEILLRFNIQ